MILWEKYNIVRDLRQRVKRCGLFARRWRPWPNASRRARRRTWLPSCRPNWALSCVGRTSASELDDVRVQLPDEYAPLFEAGSEGDLNVS